MACRCGRLTLVAFFTVFTHAADNVIKLPVQVDQQGKTIHFVTSADSDVAAEARRFCIAHMRTVNTEECTAQLVSQVDLLREERLKAQLSIPGLSFTVNNHAGEAIQFAHEEGANPADEARHFCSLHFPDAPESDCVDAMLKNAMRAFDDIREKYGKEEL